MKTTKKDTAMFLADDRNAEGLIEVPLADLSTKPVVGKLVALHDQFPQAPFCGRVVRVDGGAVLVVPEWE